jgi:hypothetical protein
MPFDWRSALDTLSTREPGSEDHWRAEGGQRWYFRWCGGRIEAAEAEGFDRWANSVLTSMAPPKTARAWAKWLRRLESAAAAREADRAGRRDKGRVA